VFDTHGAARRQNRVCCMLNFDDGSRMRRVKHRPLASLHPDLMFPALSAAAHRVVAIDIVVAFRETCLWRKRKLSAKRIFSNFCCEASKTSVGEEKVKFNIGSIECITIAFSSEPSLSVASTCCFTPSCPTAWNLRLILRLLPQLRGCVLAAP